MTADFIATALSDHGQGVVTIRQEDIVGDPLYRAVIIWVARAIQEPR